MAAVQKAERFVFGLEKRTPSAEERQSSGSLGSTFAPHLDEEVLVPSSHVQTRKLALIFHRTG